MSYTPLKESYTRTDGRKSDELRALRITPNFMPYADGSALIAMGNTRIICPARSKRACRVFGATAGRVV